MAWKKGYGQFCPVAMASELLAVRWMPLVLRELLAGSVHFAELRRGLPRLTAAVLSQRLKELMDAGVVMRTPEGRGAHAVYQLTEAGRELRPLVEALGVWGQRWAQHEPRPGEVDPELLMWMTRRRLRLDALPGARAVLCFEFPDVPLALRRFWLVIDGGDVDLCLRDPGKEVDLSLVVSARTLASIYLGQLEPEAAVRTGALTLEGSRVLARSFPAWCARSPFAAAARPARSAGAASRPSAAGEGGGASGGPGAGAEAAGRARRPRAQAR